MDAFTWMANNPYCVLTLFGLTIVGFIAFAIDCWKKR